MKRSTYHQVIGALMCEGRADLAKVLAEENKYQIYFKNKMEKFGVNSPSELTPEQFEEIDKGWKAEKETD